MPGGLKRERQCCSEIRREEVAHTNANRGLRGIVSEGPVTPLGCGTTIIGGSVSVVAASTMERRSIDTVTMD